MQKKFRNRFVLIIFFVLLSSSLLPIINGSISKENMIGYEVTINSLSDEQELDLLYGEIAFYIMTPFGLDKSFNVTYSLPPNYENQAPIFFEIKNDTTAEILSYEILNDTYSPNIVIRFNIAPGKLSELPFVHFHFWVLVKNDEFNDLPSNVEIPKENELPNETKIWLESTEAVQSDNIFIKLKARLLKKGCDDLASLADEIVKYTSNHKMRSVLYMLANMIPINRFSGWAKYLDAASSLLFGGSCTGRANLGTALFRANGVPARVVHVMPTWPSYSIKNNDFWFDMHYISEYYLPNYGWVLSETVLGTTPLEHKQNIILRINYPEDENLAGNRLGYYGGCEQWFWTESKSIRLFWTHNGSGTRSWFNNNLTTDKETANEAFNTTQKVYNMFTKYAGFNFTGENQQHFENATIAQKNAVECFKQEDMTGYNTNISFAFDKYQQIVSP